MTTFQTKSRDADAEKHFPNSYTEMTALRVKFPDKRLIRSKADMSDAFRNVRTSSAHASKFCPVLEDVAAANLRFTCGWAASPGFWRVMSSAAAQSHCNTSVYDAKILSEGEEMMSHVRIIEPWGEGKSTRIPSEAGKRPRLA